jgi:EAL domain-containing protein (putative c-di-GMP-specific phosphodiesterase class I)/GGDEF domain-containing protein
VLQERTLSIVFQPIFSFAHGNFLGYEALVRGPAGSLETPHALFNAAAGHGLVVELNIVCIQEVLRAFARKGLPGNLFLNISPQLILQRGFSQERSARFLADIGMQPSRVVIELTEDYPTFDFRVVKESLQLYRSMGFRVAIDDLGEGFSSLRLWSELKPEFVKADKHFVAGIARDAMKVQFLRAIQQIAENSGSQVIAEGIETAEDFRVVKDIGIACGQGWFIGRPVDEPAREPPANVASAAADARLPVVPAPRLDARSDIRAQDFLRSVDAVAPGAPLGALLDRFAQSPALGAIPVAGTAGIQGVVSRTWLDAAATLPDGERLRARPCSEFVDAAPIRVEGDLELPALAAMLVESDARRLGDGFVIAARGRYLGMGRSQDVMRALQDAQVIAARYTNPLTLLPGQVPINEHADRLLKRLVPFTAWYVEVDQMRGLNDGVGFKQGDALIHAVARLLESACEPGVDFAGHVAGSRFVMLVQSADWRERAQGVIDGFPALVAARVPEEDLARGYFTWRSRDGVVTVRPLPKLAVGILPVLPGVFETRHEVLLTAKQASRNASRNAMAASASAIYIDAHHGNAYPASVLLEE